MCLLTSILAGIPSKVGASTSRARACRLVVVLVLVLDIIGYVRGQPSSSFSRLTGPLETGYEEQKGLFPWIYSWIYSMIYSPPDGCIRTLCAPLLLLEPGNELPG